MGQHRDAAAGQNAADGLLRAQILVLQMELVDELLDGLVLVPGVAVLHHEVADVGLARVVQGQQLLQLFLGKVEAEAVPQKGKPCLHLLHADPVTVVDDLTDGGRCRVVAVAQDVVLPLRIPAGEFHPGDEAGVALPQQLDHLEAALAGVMVRQGKELQPRLPDAVQQLRGCVAAVGDGAVHMQVDFFRNHHG